MNNAIDYLRSHGKIGAVGLILLGIGHMVLVFMHKIEGTYEFGAATMFGGFSLLGIRKNQDIIKESVPVVAEKLGEKSDK